MDREGAKPRCASRLKFRVRFLPSGSPERVFTPFFRGRLMSLEGSFLEAPRCVSPSPHTHPAALRDARPSPPARTGGMLPDHGRGWRVVVPVRSMRRS